MTRLGAMILTLALASGCAEERIVSRRGLLSSVPGAESKIPDARSMPKAEVLRTPESGIRQTHDDGTIVLHAKSVHHLITHLIHVIQNGEADLFVQYLLCEQTLEEFRTRRIDPRVGFEEIVRRQRDAFRLFTAMPFGEATPGLYLQPIGRNEFRLELPRSSWDDMSWVGIDVVFEKGNYRLRWFVPRHGK